MTTDTRPAYVRNPSISGTLVAISSAPWSYSIRGSGEVYEVPAFERRALSFGTTIYAPATADVLRYSRDIWTARDQDGHRDTTRRAEVLCFAGLSARYTGASIGAIHLDRDLPADGRRGSHAPVPEVRDGEPL